MKNFFNRHRRTPRLVTGVKSRKVRVKGVGEVLLERSARARHICLSVRPFKGVRVAVPRGVSFAAAQAVAESKAGWLNKHLAKIDRIEQQALALNRDNPLDLKAAKERLINRLVHLSKQHGITFNRVFVRTQKTRWGSCSAKNNINLNANLVRIPARLMDYTILHELVHTRIKDHSRRFWDELERYQADAKGLDKELNQYKAFLNVIQNKLQPGDER